MEKTPRHLSYKIYIDRIGMILKWCAKCSVVVSFVAIAVGTFFSLIHSHANDLHFHALSIVQCALITIICGILTVSFIVLEHIMLGIVRGDLQYRSEHATLKGLLAVAIMGGFIIMATGIASYILNDLLTAFIVCCGYYIVGIFIVWNTKSNKALIKITTGWVLVWCLLIMMLIPMNFGGFRSREVEYCAHNAQECQDYTYYGISDGLYQFVDSSDGENYVVLISTDSGYIRYTQEKTKLFGFIEL